MVSFFENYVFTKFCSDASPRSLRLRKQAKKTKSKGGFMPGKDRLLLVGHPHHLVRKSHGNEPIFLDEADYSHCPGSTGLER